MDRVYIVDGDHNLCLLRMGVLSCDCYTCIGRRHREAAIYSGTVTEAEAGPLDEWALDAYLARIAADNPRWY